MVVKEIIVPKLNINPSTLYIANTSLEVGFSIASVVLINVSHFKLRKWTSEMSDNNGYTRGPFRTEPGHPVQYILVVLATYKYL